MTPAVPLSVVVLHRGEPPALVPDPWATPNEARVDRLAHAIATSVGWAKRGKAILVVRASPDPVIAAIGRFDASDAAWLTGASQQLASLLPRVVLLDHDGVETACHQLANELIVRYGREAVRSFRYAAVPRGGLMVLGHLAYLLDLPPHRVSPLAECREARDKLVLVDDIAISGLRLSQTIAPFTDCRLVLATLHAHPAMRTAFINMHPQVDAFVSACDLRDHAPVALGDEYVAWRMRWEQRAEHGTVWIGQPDHVAYPWNEPDLGVWNPVSDHEEPGWHVVPPERCLKRRAGASVPVQRIPDTPGPLIPHPSVVFGEIDSAVVIGHLESGTTYSLEGVGAYIWRALVETGTIHTAATRAADAFGVDRQTITKEVTQLVSDLLAADLLVEADA